jgi:DNA-binding NarL/FixJ family response regulator
VTAAQRPVRVIICDDHPIVIMGIRAALSERRELHLVGEASDGSQAADAAVRLRPDVMLMDLRMPVMGGVQAIAAIKENAPEVNVIVFSQYDTDADVLRAIEAGARGFVLKNAQPEMLVRAVLDVVSGGSPLASTAAARLLEQIQGGSNALSTREIEVLQLIALGSTTTSIADELNISPATVGHHLTNLFHKLGASDRTSAVVKAYKRGILRLEQ